MTSAQLPASIDLVSGQIYVPPRTFVADGSLRQTESLQVPAQGVLFSATTFNGDAYGIVDLDCGARIQALLKEGTDCIGTRVKAMLNNQGETRFAHD